MAEINSKRKKEKILVDGVLHIFDVLLIYQTSFLMNEILKAFFHFYLKYFFDTKLKIKICNINKIDFLFKV